MTIFGYLGCLSRIKSLSGCNHTVYEPIEVWSKCVILTVNVIRQYSSMAG